MAQTEHALAAEQPPAPSPRVEGWVQYYEYFHKLNDDMQVRSGARNGPAGGASTLRAGRRPSPLSYVARRTSLAAHF